MMAEDGLETLKDFDAIYFGAVGWENVPDHISLWGLRLNITQNFDQWANIRPVKFLPGVQSPLRKADDTELDWVVVRENSEGEYAGLGGRNLSAAAPATRSPCRPRCSPRRAASGSSASRSTSPAPARVKKVSSVTKSNAQQYGMVLWDETFARVALDYPDVATESVLVDAMSAKFVLKPEDLSVVVASNLNADILSDLGSALAGSLGLAASANLNPERRFPSMFEPVHGSAPDIAGQGISNPIGTIASAALMLDHFGLHEEAAPPRGRHRGHHRLPAHLTRDIGGTPRPTRSPTRSSRPWTCTLVCRRACDVRSDRAAPRVRCRPLPRTAWAHCRSCLPGTHVARTSHNEVGTMASITGREPARHAEPRRNEWYRQLYFWVSSASSSAFSWAGWPRPPAWRWNPSAPRSSTRCGC